MAKIARWRHSMAVLGVSIVIIGLAAVVFRELMTAAATAEIEQIQINPVSYRTIELSSTEESAFEATIQPVYSLVNSNMEQYGKPAAADLSREEAAEIGVRQLTAVFGVDLNGATIEMGYLPTKDGRRAVWLGFWYYEGVSGPPNRYYSFRVDALTGSVHDVGFTRTMKLEDISREDGTMLDEYRDDQQAFEAYALQVAGELNVVNSTVAELHYHSQNVTTEQNVIFEVIGENSTRAWLYFSRHDKALLGIVYHMGLPDLG